MRRALAFGALLVAGILGLARKGSLQPAQAEVPTKADQERARNDERYEKEYLHRKDVLFIQHPGDWISIVRGKLSDPFPSLIACAAAAEKEHPSAAHRYMFRIGEEGDVHYDGPAPLEPCQPLNVVGGTFKALFHIGFAWQAGGDDAWLAWERSGKRRTFQWKRPSRITGLEIADPLASTRAELAVVDSGSSTALLLLDTPTASALGLERFEIPGRAVVDYSSERIQCRRARARVRVPEIDLDETVPIAVWPK